MIRGTGPRPDPESFAFSFLMNFFMDPDPRIRIRVHVTPNSFKKNFKHDIFEREIGSAPPLSGFVHVFTFFSFKKDAVPGLRIETRIRTEVRIRASALAPVP